ncbi:hypothetical protein EBE87_16700 [Pseudoroseomonas wenyumeiae]|uniref:Uncharacterized protein n=1 Tax=Teichococcus wenyumeiae TaxID=2478470 RepID=A0A3A9JGL6_9PROT|nr:hypothetical protein [Pseudoroseomonas wenyumeiae]RKK03655.1 hypothetical protein D6Z83_13565 [Pseudoroseomonas wenyumeiae]RMI20122.1 hypothetical protein EBE87_16700 [Pseudoroseomonas wenyumeiae]
MIAPAPNVKKRAVEPPAPLPSRLHGTRESTAGALTVAMAERQKQMKPSDPVHDVHLDSETVRLYTEMHDPETGRVLLRLPAAFQGEGTDKPAGAWLEA